MKAERVKKHRENNDERALEYNRKHKKDMALNWQYMNKHNENKAKKKKKGSRKYSKRYIK